MPRKPSPKKKQAFELWEQSGRSRELKDIAAELGVSPEQVRKWKSQDKWDSVTLPNTNSNVTKSKSNVTKPKTKEKRPRGAPKGNKNALGNSGGAPLENQNAVGNPGGGAPLGNKNAFKHGLREKLLFEAKGLSEDEQALAVDTEFDETAELRKTIRDCDLKIIHYEKLKREMLNKPAGVTIQSISKISLAGANASDGSASMTTNHIAVTEYILRYEREIHKYERLRAKCLETLIKINAEKRKREEDKSNIVDQHNKKLNTLANLLNNPVKNRKPADFEDDNNG